MKGLQQVLAQGVGRFGLKTWLRRRWCPRGVRPPWSVDQTYEWLWLYVAVEPATGRGAFAFLPTMESGSREAFLGEVSRAFGNEPVGIVLDNASSHRSGQVHWPAAYRPLALPAYSPELDPAEQIFRQMRQALANRLFERLEDLEAALTEARRPFWEDPLRLKRLTGFPWWTQAIDAHATSSP